jgi:hypothetical protein
VGNPLAAAACQTGELGKIRRAKSLRQREMRPYLSGNSLTVQVRHRLGAAKQARLQVHRLID